jgi:glyoxylase-like metal-dependent hydrolase (beta-lactamase superfamily II)
VAEQAPAPLLDRGIGPAVATGVAVELAPALVRVTAPNPSMMTGPGTNTYLVGDGPLVVIDPGPDSAPHRAALLEAIAGREVSHILVTHTHPDHAPGAGPLGRVVGAPLAGYGPSPSFEPNLLLADGDTVGSGEHALLVLHTPGHASNHLCYVLGAARLCFTGDHVMHGSTVVIRPPDGDLHQYLDSLARLRDAEPPVRILAPGHGRLMDHVRDEVDALVAHRLARHELVAAGLAGRGAGTVDDLLPAVYGDVTDQLLPVARFSLWAHLRALGVEGRAALVDAVAGQDTAESCWAAT